MRSRHAPIDCRSLTKRFDGLAVVDDLSFEVAAETITGFAGANGAGKTTTMPMILGLVAPIGDEALVNSRAYRDLDHPQREVGAVLDGPGAHPAHRARPPRDILARAVEQRDTHALEFARASGREHALRPDPPYLAAAHHVLHHLPD